MSDEARHDHPRGGVMYQPTDEQRRMVKVMSGFGIPQPDIAAQIGIDTKTLRKHFREELDRGMTEANMRVAQSLFSMATTGGSVAAAIFWMKARAGWREKSVVEHTGADGRQSYVIHGGAVPDDALTAEAWADQFRPGGNPAGTLAPHEPLTIDLPDPEGACHPCSTPTNDRCSVMNRTELVRYGPGRGGGQASWGGMQGSTDPQSA